MTDFSGQNIGRYHIIEKLGQGGMATVYRAYDTRLEREIAIKVIRRGAFGEEQLASILRRFEREAKAVARLDHPNIVRVHDFGEHEGAPYLVMQFLPGGSLKSKTGSPMPYQQAIQVILPVARALAFAHQNEIIHRDVKPANILITKDGIPVLSDFGIAKIIESEESTQLTSTGVGIGTPEYMAPEQWEGSTGPQTDVYALGVVLYELITGRKPYMAETPAAIYRMMLTEPLPRPRNYAPDLPEEMERVLFKAMAKSTADRYPSMDAFITNLKKITTLSPQPALVGDTLSVGGDKKPAAGSAARQEKPQPSQPIPSLKSEVKSERIKSKPRYTWWILGGALVGLAALTIIIYATIIGINLLKKDGTPTQPAALAGTSVGEEPSQTPQPATLTLTLAPTRASQAATTPEPTGENPSPTIAPMEPVTLEIWTTEVDAGFDYWQALAEEYNQSHPNVTIIFSPQPPADFIAMVDTVFAAGAPPDMFLVEAPSMRKYALNGSIVPPGDIVDFSRYSPKLIELSLMDGVVWGVPVFTQGQIVLFYNKSTLARPPQNTDEMIEFAKQAGFSYFHRGSFFILPWLGGFGGSYQSNWTNPPQLNSYEMIQTLNFLYDLTYNHEVLPPNSDYGTAENDFLSGKTSMLINGTWAYQYYRETLENNLGIAPLPQVSSTGNYPSPFIHGTQFYITNNTLDENTRNAITSFLEYATNQENQLKMAKELFYLPALKSVYGNPAIVDDPLFSVMLQQLPKGTSHHIGMNLDCLLSSTDPFYNAFMDKSISAEEAAENMQQEVEICFQQSQ